MTTLRPLAWSGKLLRVTCATTLRSSCLRYASSSATTEPLQPGKDEKLSTSAGFAKRVKLTEDSYPGLKRNPDFASLTAEHVQYLRNLLGSSSAYVDDYSEDSSGEVESYNCDWMRKYRGKSKLVLLPENTKQVSEILRFCNENRLAVVPQGGNTGLVGGSVPVFDEIIINMKRMTGIRSFDDASGILVVNSGAILEATDSYLAERKHIFPLDLGAKGSCQIGGNIATNAGGIRLLRYGSLHGSVVGIEAVLPDGTVLDDITSLRKNNTGYDLKQLFIGSEGTLGIVTAISILCPRKSTAVNVAVLAVPEFPDCIKVFKEAKKHLGEILSAVELMDDRSQKLLAKATGRKLPFEDQHQFYCLIETSGSDFEHDSQKLEKFLEDVMSNGAVSDGILAQDKSQADNLWACREGISESLGHWGGVYKYDISLPLQDMYSLVPATRAHLQELGLFSDTDSESDVVVDVVGYGHLGDGNIHLNIATRGFDKRVEEALEPWVFKWVSEHHGSISAEHGLGLAKKPFVGYSRSNNMINVMKSIKSIFDPNGIMNPYKYI